MTPSRSHELRTARADDEPSLHALWAVCFPAGTHLPALHALDPDRLRRTFVAARPEGGVEGSVEAALVVVPRTVRDADGTPVRIGGIGSVATHPAARGRGLVRALLGEAVRAMEAEGFAWSLLFTNTPGVYEGSGWRTFARVRAEGEPARAPVAGSGARYRVRDADPSDLPRLHAAAHAARPLTALRTEGDWRVRVPSWYGPDACWLVAERPGARHPVGYAVSRPSAEEVLSVEEFGTVPGEEGCLAALLSAHAGRARARGVPRVRIPLTPDNQQPLPSLMSNPTWHTDRTGMLRPLHEPAPRTVDPTYWLGDAF